MKKILLVLTSALLCVAGLCLVLNSIGTHAQGTCCVPPQRNPAVPRFPPYSTVDVYLDAASGFTDAEMDDIETGFEDWNGQPNNAGITYNVIKNAPPPPPGTGNTIVASYSDTQSSIGIAATQAFSNGPNVYMTVVFHKNIRNGIDPPALVRAVSRHEAGHGLGLDNADNCPPGSTIMRLNHLDGIEDQIRGCDNEGVNNDPAYPCQPPSGPPSDAYYWDTVSCSWQWGGNPGCNSAEAMECGYPNYWREDACRCEWHSGECAGGENCTPVVIDVKGDGFDLTNVSHGVLFDLSSDGYSGWLAWTQADSDDAWLALDRNSNSMIDNGAELFGDFTSQPAFGNKNGFLALAEFDKPALGGNRDGEITQSDSVFSSLRLWQDSNHNGVSEPSELHTFADLGLATLDLTYKESRRTDEHGNRFRYRAKVKDIHGAQISRWAWDVYLVTQPIAE